MANWQEDELLLRLQLYCRTLFGTLDHRKPDFIELVNAIGSKASVLAFKATKTHIVQILFHRVVLTSINHRFTTSSLFIPQLLLRTNPSNGIILNELYDKTFDRCLMSFDGDFRSVYSDRIKKQKNNQMIQEYFFGVEGKASEMPKRFLPDKLRLIAHRWAIRMPL